MKKGFSLKSIGKVEKNVDACIQLHKLIDSGDEQGAINLINSERGIDVSYEYNQRIPVFSAINSNMYDLFEVIVNHPTFDSAVEDGFGETLLGSLLYMYVAEETQSNAEEERILRRLIDSILKNDNYFFNATDINDDTAINIACEYPKMLWIVEALAAKKYVSPNIINYFDCTALTNAIRNQNTEAIKVLAKRSDLLVRDYDVEAAKEYNIKLEDYGIDTSHCIATIVDDTAERNREDCFAIACE